MPEVNLADDDLWRLFRELQEEGFVYPDAGPDIAVHHYLLIDDQGVDFQPVRLDRKAKIDVPIQPGPRGRMDITKLPTIPVMEGTPPFKMPYDSAEEINLRLKGTIIRMDNIPVYVMGVHQNVYDELLEPRRTDPLAMSVLFPNNQQFIGLPGAVDDGV